MPTFAEKTEPDAMILARVSPQDRQSAAGQMRSAPDSQTQSIFQLQSTIGNRAVQRLLNRGREDQRESPVAGSAAGSISQSISPSLSGWLGRQPHLALDARGGAGGDGDPVDRRVYRRANQCDERMDGILARDPDDLTGGTIPASAAPPAPAPASGTATPPAPTAPARPTPVNVRNGPTHAAIDSGDTVGMSIAITITSSSGVDADMAAIQDSEKVAASSNHVGSMAGLTPMLSNNSGFMAGFPIPDDQHAWSRSFLLDRFDHHGGAGSFEKEQLDVFTDAAGGVPAATAIPASGYLIKREISASGTSVVLKTSKHGAAATAGGFSSTAGPSGMQSETVTLRR